MSNRNVRSDALRPRSALVNWLALLLSATSVLGLLIALLGYGVALSVQAQFGIPHSAIFSSSLDLFNLGGWGAVQIVSTALTKAATWNFYADLLSRSWPLSLSVMLMVAALALLSWGATRFWRRFGSYVRELLLLKASNLNAVVSRTRTLLTWVAVLVGFVLTVIVGTPLLLAAGMIGISILCVMLALIPAIGMTAGESYIDDWVIRPTICVPVQSRMDRLNPLPHNSDKTVYAANCVAITRGNEPPVRGRVVFATPNAIVLYDPETGAVRRVSTEGSTVEVIGVLSGS